MDPNGPVPDDTSITAAGGRPTEYLELAKKGGGHSGTRTFLPFAMNNIFFALFDCYCCCCVT